MNNLHRELAPISDAAWADIEAEAKRTFTLNLAGRRVVDVQGPSGSTLAAVSTGHLTGLDSPAEGVIAWAHQAQPVVEFRVPFTLNRVDIDSVERGAEDPDWRPVKDAARGIAFAEDGAIFDGYSAGSITGIRASSSNPEFILPADVRAYPDVVAGALANLRRVGVGGPYALLLSSTAYTAVSETSDHGYPVREHLGRVVDGEILLAPAIDGAILVSTRGGDFDLYLGQDLSIGYLSHDADQVELYFTESFTFLVHTAEASV
ncbi:MAG TPA: family 1 encapsulin nanocompartment shell protein, partial [Streptosporangiaceae bacterium]|nr:family 1 encapsulin nanocompartment shell protein [Streptosporangiaceae bacterium]